MVLASESIIEYVLKANPKKHKPVYINKSNDAYDFIKTFYSDDLHIYESFFIFTLNPKGKVIGFVKLSQGGINGTIVDIRLVCKYAVDSLATSVIIAHNHPSGNLQPSESDKKITERIKKALEIFDIRLNDHIILGAEGYMSFADSYIL